MKTCNEPNCKQINPQPLTAFSKSKATKDGLQYKCKSCDNFIKREQYNNDKEKHLVKSRLWFKKNKDKSYEARHKYNSRNPDKVRGQRCQRYWPGSTWAEALSNYNDLFNKQHGCCAICNKNQSELKLALAVDHNHNTGKVRGLLCKSCNTALGHMYDSIESVERMFIYLKN